MKGKSKGMPMPKMPSMNGENMSMDIRKISNGYIVRTSGTKGKGKNQTYFSHEAYSPNKPAMSFGRKK